MEKLTRRQSEVYRFIRDFIQKNHYSPSIRDIAEQFGVYVRAAYDHILALEKKGYIVREKGKTRSIKLTRDYSDSDVSQFPVLGQISAGNPLESVEHVEDFLIVSNNLFKGDTLFALKVRGDSMVDAGIFEDDYVIVDTSINLKNGEIGVVLLDNETTIKRVFFEKTRIKLKPENPALEPIYSSNVKVIGKVVGLMRKF